MQYLLMLERAASEGEAEMLAYVILKDPTSCAKTEREKPDATNREHRGWSFLLEKSSRRLFDQLRNDGY
jgi:hypothetical protein